MAIVPIQEAPQVKLQPLDTTPIRAVDTGGVASGFAAGASDLGKGLDQAAQVQEQADNILDEGAVKQLDNSYLSTSIKLKSDYLATKGQNALDQRQDVEKQLTQTASDLMGQATSPRQKIMLGDLLQRRQAADLGDIAEHWTNEGTTYADDESKGRQALAAAAAGQNYTNPAEADRNIATIGSEIDAQAKLNGWAPDFAAAKKQQAVSDARLDIIQRLSQTGPQGPSTASAYADRYKDSLAPDDMEKAQAYITAHQNSIEAEARRQEAESREAENRAKTESGQQARATIALAEIGLVPPDQVAGMISAAKASGDPSLVFQAGLVAKKNQTKQVYQNLTPAELQPHINELAARIHNAGDSPDPGDEVELKTLQEIQGQSVGAIKSDSLSWAAQHLGIDSGLINWNDQSSIANRVQSAQRVAARTGAQPQYLTAPEAAQMAPAWATGTAEDKVALVQRLARLGPGSTAAAGQVAPNDPVLPGLVGLASIPDPSVASAMVHTTMAGPEAIKAHKDLVSGPGVPAMMDTTYTKSLGGALRLMPTTDAAVRSISTNYYAAKMASQGIYQYDDRRYPMAISAALGGYNDHGVMRGGLGTSNGGTTVLPVGVSQAEFDQKIARMPAGAGQNAGNGIPQWSNGATLTIGDMKRAQYVPVGDGRYALFTNGSFVQRKGGGRYEVDWRKLP